MKSRRLAPMLALALALAVPTAWAGTLAASPAQAALAAKLKPEARFTLEGVTFTGTTTTLQPTSNKALLDLAAVLKTTPGLHVRLEVFVDPTDPAGQALSDKRAQLLLARLTGFGAPAGSVEAKGMGGTEVIFPSIVEATRAKNRRVVVHVIPPGGAVEAVATPKPEATPIAAATPLPPSAGRHPRVIVVSTRATPPGASGSASSALRSAGAELARVAAVKETRPTATVYFTPGFQDEARRYAVLNAAAPARLVPVQRIDVRTDILFVLGAESWK